MIKKVIVFENFDGETEQKTCWFHISKAELMDMVIAEPDLAQKLSDIGTRANGAEIIRTFTDFVRKAYGERVDGSGSDFHKSPKTTENFMNSLVFDKLLEELMSDPESAGEFINGIFPKDLMAAARNLPDPNGVDSGAGPWPTPSGPPTPPAEKELPWANREPTQKELTGMTHDQLLAIYARRSKGWNPPA